MGAKQSKAERQDAGHAPRSSGLCGACCFPTARPSSTPDDLAADPVSASEKTLHHGELLQPTRRSKMTMFGGRPDSMATPPARSLSARRASKKRPRSRAKADLPTSADVPPPLPTVKYPRHSPHQQPSSSAELHPDDPTFLPQNKRLSPMPDFGNYGDQSIDALASTPWVAVRQMAERMPSRRSSALAPPANSNNAASQSPPSLSRKSSNGNNSILSRPSLPSSNSRKDSQPSVASSPFPPRKDSQFSHLSHHSRETPASAQEDPLPRHPAAQSANLRVKISHGEEVPLPLKSGKSIAESFDTTRAHAPSTRLSSPKLPPTRTFPLKSAMKGGRKASTNSAGLSPKSPGAHSTVEDAVRELQEIVEAKRGTASFETMRSGTTVASNRFSEQPQSHRAAVAPGMVVQASAGLLDDIGSVLSRPVSDATLTSQMREELPVSPTSSSGMPRITQQWKMRASPSPAGSAANSGTFFLGGPTSRPTSPAPPAAAAAAASGNGDESPVDRPWTLERPVSTDLNLDDVSASSRAPGRQPTWRGGGGRLSRSSSIAVANPVSHLSSISTFRDTASWRALDLDLDAAESVTSFSFIDAGMSSSSTGRRPSATPSLDHSAAVQAARSRIIGAGIGPGPALTMTSPLRSPSLRSFASRDDSSIVSVRSPWGGWTAPHSPAPTLTLPQPRSMISPPMSPLTALPALTQFGPPSSNGSSATPATKLPRALAGAVRPSTNTASPQHLRAVQQNEARPRTARGAFAPRSAPLATVGEGAAMRLTAADAAQRRDASARRLREVERELEAVEMERGLARLSQVGVAF